MQRVSDNYRKLRNTLRFLLGNLHDFTPATDAILDFQKLEPLDQYILARTAELDAKVRRAYDTFEFHRAYHALNEFVNTDLSALYLDVIKDRLYTFAPNAAARRSAQTALWRIAEALTRLIAPILSFTADEVWPLLPHVEGREGSVHLALFPNMQEIIPGTVRQLEEDWSQLLSPCANEVMQGLEEQRALKSIGKSLSDASVKIEFGGPSSAANLALTGKYQTVQCRSSSMFQLSNIVPRSDVAAEWWISNTVQSAPGAKCERCWRYVPDVAANPDYPTVCLRCAEALTAIQYAPYPAPQDSGGQRLAMSSLPTMTTPETVPRTRTRDATPPPLPPRRRRHRRRPGLQALDRPSHPLRHRARPYPQILRPLARPQLRRRLLRLRRLRLPRNRPSHPHRLLPRRCPHRRRPPLAHRSRPHPFFRRPRPHPRRSHRQPLRPYPLPLRHRLPPGPHRPLPLARLQPC